MVDSDLNEFISIYPTIDYEDIWESLFNLGKFVRTIGKVLAGSLGYSYPIQDDINVVEYIRKIRVLPKDAMDFT